jgi:hypothetical protein
MSWSIAPQPRLLQEGGGDPRREAAVVLDIINPSILIAMEFGHRST